MVGWKGKDAVKDGTVAFSCLLNCLRVSLLGFSSYINVTSMLVFSDDATTQKRVF